VKQRVQQWRLHWSIDALGKKSGIERIEYCFCNRMFRANVSQYQCQISQCPNCLAISKIAIWLFLSGNLALMANYQMRNDKMSHIPS
jgi:hypothetical protein